MLFVLKHINELIENTFKGIEIESKIEYVVKTNNAIKTNN